MGAENFLVAEARTATPTGSAAFPRRSVVLQGLNLGVEQQCKTRQLGSEDGRTTAHPSPAPPPPPARRPPPPGIYLRSSARCRLHAGEVTRPGWRRGAAEPCDTRLPCPVLARADVVPKGQCDNSCGFSALRQQSPEAGARVAAPLGSSGAG